MKATRRPTFLLCAVGLFSCTSPEPKTPVETYLAFARSAQKGDAQKAYAFLSKSTQEALSEKAKRASGASGGALSENPAALFFALSPSATSVSEVKLVHEESGSARVQVEAGEKRAEVALLLEPSGWKVDLPEAKRD